MAIDYHQARARMVEQQVRARGIRDERVLSAMLEVPRHRFVDSALEAQAYTDRALPISHSQTISQPFMVGLMTALLEVGPDDRVLEVGTGSGYQAAVLSRLARTVYTIEVIPELAEGARRVFRDLGLENILQCVGDGSLGWPAHAPYDAITVTAGAPNVPGSLRGQLADGGRLVAPTGSRASQVLHLLRRRGNEWLERTDTPCIFVPLVGQEGWDPV